MSGNAELIQATRASGVEEEAFSHRISERKRAIGLDGPSDSLGPSAKTRALAESNAARRR